MKIAISTVQIPFITGGAEFLAQNLKKALIDEGHEVEIVTMPFVDNPLCQIENHIVASRLLDINNSWGGDIDLCIGLKFPAYYMKHENKIIWALHQHRAAYDLFDTAFSNLKNDKDGKYYQSVIKNADNTYLNEAKRIYTIADNVANRLKKYNGIKATTLYHPCPDMESFFCDEYKDYILMPSRINATKRQMLALEAISKTKSDIKLYIVGRPDNPTVENQLLDFIKEHNLENKVRYFGAVSQDEKFKLYSNAKAVLFIPLDEDYGYITLEAMSSSKAVITAKDSGGPLEFIEDGKNGFVVDPNPEEIAKAIDSFVYLKNQALDMGNYSKKHLNEMDITWKHVVEELTK